MKNLKVKIIAFVLVALASAPVMGQEYKIAMSSGVIAFEEISELAVEAYDGNEVIIQTGGNYKIPDRAKGLRPLNASGLTDNTGIGLATKKDGSTVTVYQVTRSHDAKYSVKVPKGVTIKYKNSSIHGDDFYAKNISAELEVSTHGGDIHLVEITGPVTANSVHGDIDVVFSTVDQKLPSSVASVHGDVDVAFPTSSKADMKISTNWGEVYSDLDIEVETHDGLKVYGAKKIDGKVGGGGVNISVSSTHGNVYLRKR